MERRRCSLCGWYYIDDDGHDRVECFQRLQMRIAELENDLADTRSSLEEARQRLTRY